MRPVESSPWQSMRSGLSKFQRELLDEFWNNYLSQNTWPTTRATHSRYEKSKTREALRPLGSGIVIESEDSSNGNRYVLSLTGALITSKGEDYRKLLTDYFTHLRDLFYTNPEQRFITEAEISKALSLSKDSSNILGKLLNLAPFYDCSLGGEQWTARIHADVEGFPKHVPLTAQIDALLLRNHTGPTPVFVDERRAQLQPVFSAFQSFEPTKEKPLVTIDALKRRYQVFVSSTYDDLKAERQQVMQALLETRCIPTGMELFPASSLEQWDLIKRVIDECDYYVVIVAGCYGSLGKTGLSYTEQEFDYATSIGKPVIGFYHRDINTLQGSKLADSDEAKSKLKAFAKKVKGRLCRPWSTADELGSAVKSAILNELEFSPQTGWIRADMAPATEAVDKLKQRIADLEERLKQVSQSERKPKMPDKGGEEVEILVEGLLTLDVTGPFLPDVEGREYSYQPFSYPVRKTWDQLLVLLAEQLQHQVDGAYLKKHFEEKIWEEIAIHLRGEFCVSRLGYVDPKFPDDFFDRMLQTFAARKLVRIILPRSRYTSQKAFQLTPAGVTRVAELMAL